MKRILSFTIHTILWAGCLVGWLLPGVLYGASLSSPAVADTDTVVEARFVLVDTVGGTGATPGNTELARILRNVPTTAELDAYFGWTGMQFDATGRFRTEQLDGYWYLINPLGHPFFSVAPNSVQQSYPNIVLPEDLLEPGFNSLGNWSAYAAINQLNGPEVPYVTRINFLQSYKNTSQRLKDLYNKGIIAVFDPGFKVHTESLAREVIPLSEDSFCIGIFTDNELPAYDNTKYGVLLERFLQVDSSDPNHIAAHQWMVDRKGEGYTIDDKDREEFHGFLFGNYYRIVHDAIRNVAPDLLILGSRLHGGAKYKPSLFREAGKYVDVISVNFYGPYNPPEETIAMWLEESDKPFLISEYYAKAYDVGMENSSGAGNKVPTQIDRSIYFENFTLQMLESKGCVGVHWHRFQDDVPADANKGFINENGSWYAPLKRSLSNITRDIYGLRDFLKPVPGGLQAVLYDTINFLGKGIDLASGDYSSDDLANIGLNPEDIMSVKLVENFKLVLYENDDLTGDSVEITSSDGYIKNNLRGLNPGSLSIGRDYKIIRSHPLEEITAYKTLDRGIDLNEVFTLSGGDGEELRYTIPFVSQDAPFNVSISGSLLSVSIPSGDPGEGIVVVQAAYDNETARDTLKIIRRKLKWNAVDRDTYTRGGEYSATNYGAEQVVLVKNSAIEKLFRTGFFGFDIDPVHLPASYAKVELVAGVNTFESTVKLEAYGLDYSTWSEMELTRYNQPDLPEVPISTIEVSTNNETTVCRWDVSDFVRSKLVADEYAFTIVMKAEETAINPARIDALEGGGQFAHLEFSVIEDTDNTITHSLELYPNPAKDFLYLRNTKCLQGPVNIEVFSSSGDRLLRLRNNDPEDVVVDIRHLEQGLCFFRLTDATASVTRKFIVAGPH